MQKVALRHGMVCLLHEKPYAGVNGSGKHNNWSLATDTGVNLLDPGHTPQDNAQFLVFLCALLKAVDTHADIMRATCASSGNDHRLGANEAPPAIISAFLGDELTDIMERLAKGQKATGKGQNFLDIGVDTLPELPKDNTDRNRTSPFAFTGNKFEFRMVGSSQSISGPNVALNTIVADALDEIATRLEKAGKNRNAEITAIVKETWKKHSKVVFNGNNYAEEWVKEADKRGLPNVRNAVAALEAFVTPKAMKLFEKHKVLSKEELHSRYDIYLEQYSKHINIEANTAVQMTRRQFIPAAMRFMTELGNSVAATGKHGVVQRELLAQVGELLGAVQKKAAAVESEAGRAKSIGEVPKQAAAFRDKVFPALQKLRADVDELEGIVPRDLWPVPSYSDMLFKL
jgi:glutamine synthetase